LKLIKCPHPECDHVGEVLTHVHCKVHHGVKRDTLIEKYGEPEILNLSLTNSVHNWARRSTVRLNDKSFGSTAIPPKRKGVVR
jgi:hypothetical protein